MVKQCQQLLVHIQVLTIEEVHNLGIALNHRILQLLATSTLPRKLGERSVENSG